MKPGLRICMLCILPVLAAPALSAAATANFGFHSVLLPEETTRSAGAVRIQGTAAMTVRVQLSEFAAVREASLIVDVAILPMSGDRVTGITLRHEPAGGSGATLFRAATQADTEDDGGRITRLVALRDTESLTHLQGLLNRPDLYYLGVETSMRGRLGGPLRRSSIRLRPILTPGRSMTSLDPADAMAAAAIDLGISYGSRGEIRAGSAVIRLDYDFPKPATILGFQIRRGASEETGPVVLEAHFPPHCAPSVPSTRGTLSAAVDVPPGRSETLAALGLLLEEPEKHYAHVVTRENTGNALRGQLGRTTIGTLLRAPADPNSRGALLAARLQLDDLGNLEEGDFQLTLPAADRTGLPDSFRIAHRGADEPFVSGTLKTSGRAGISGSILAGRQEAQALGVLRGLLLQPELYDLELRAPDAVTRIPVSMEEVHLPMRLSGGAESGGGTRPALFTAAVQRDLHGFIRSGRLSICAQETGDAARRPVRLEIVDERPPGTTVLNLPLDAPSDARRGWIDETSLDALTGILDNPAQHGVRLHLEGETILQGTLAPEIRFAPDVIAGDGWASVVTVSNRSPSSSAAGFVHLFDTHGNPALERYALPTAFLWLPPGGSRTFATGDRGVQSRGYLRASFGGDVELEISHVAPHHTRRHPVTSVVGRTVLVPVAVRPEEEVKVAVLTLKESGTHLVLELRDSNGSPITGGMRSIELGPDRHFTAHLRDLFPEIAVEGFRGTLRIERRWAAFSAGSMAVAVTRETGDGVLPLPLTVER